MSSKLMHDKEFWESRAIKFGHTGNADPFYYCFDQQARLFAINIILKQIKSRKELALDYGCGSGDFISLLNKYYKKTLGFDISETIIGQLSEKFKKNNTFVTHNILDLKAFETFDLILTVTVLQCISKKEIENIIPLFSKILSDQGFLICMEFFWTDNPYNTINLEYISVSEWRSFLEKNKLKIVETFNFYNPVDLPSKSWQMYNSSIFLKFLKPFKNYQIVQKYLTSISKKLIQKYQDVIPSESSQYKIYFIQKNTIAL